jgi:hypothetical protein
MMPKVFIFIVLCKKREKKEGGVLTAGGTDRTITSRAVEERNSKAFFKRSDLSRNRRLGDMKFIHSPAIIQIARNHVKDL